jgi:hypothetical protein
MKSADLIPASLMGRRIYRFALERRAQQKNVSLWIRPSASGGGSLAASRAFGSVGRALADTPALPQAASCNWQRTQEGAA